MAVAYAHINPENLRWARERANLTMGMLARKLNISEEKLVAWENGHKKITFNQAKSVAEKTYIPFGYLFLKNTPKEKLPIPDLRTVDGEELRQPSAELLKIIQIVIARQHWYQEYQAEQGIENNSYIGRFNSDSSFVNIVNDMRTALGVGAHPERGSWEEYQRVLVKRIEAIGILVMRHGDLGHHTKKLSVEEFRGFAIFDKTSPVIFVNQADAPSARLFTLIHELAHIWIGQSGVSDASTKAHRKEEVLCNAVAAEFLVPQDEFLNLWQDNKNWMDNLPELEAHFHVSKWVLARRALTLKIITHSQYSKYITLLKKQYENREKTNSAPSYYRTVKSQISENFSRALIAETLSGKVLLRDAGQLLGMKPNNITKFAKELGI
jgi:Zn-dependent peptidase ImmA (M78 family)/DNA-binding XRE family transcriptional regulator